MKKSGSAALFRSGWMALAVILLVVIFLSINWYYYRLTRKSLNEDFTVRLKTLASIVSLNIDPSVIFLLEPDALEPAFSDTLTMRLQKIAAEHSLSNILIFREDGVILTALQPDLYPPGEIYPHWNMDYVAIIGALEGTPSATDLYRAPGGTYLKAGYAPFPLYADPPGAVAAVEASADFLRGLQDLRAVLLAATAVSVLGIALFIWFVLKATGSLIQARESLMHAETLASMGRMAAGIAHEIRNPLFIIRSSAEKLKHMHPEDSGEIDGFITEEVDRLNGILTDYLLFARNEPAAHVSMDLVTVLRRSVQLVDESIQEGEVRFVTSYSLKEAPFRGEEKKLQQSFLNILLNARQSIESPGTVGVSISREGNRYIIGFEDSGTGIAEKDIDKIVEPFYTTKPTGSGLGLAIAKKVIEDHGGRLNIKSRLGAGTTVTITLPTGKSTGDGNEQDPHSR